MKNFVKLLLLVGLALTSASALAKKKPKRKNAAAASSAGMNCQNPSGAMACMTCNCYNEAGGESYQGQVAVGKVVMTRVGLKEFPNDICKVVKQPSQFSWYNKKSTRKSVPAGHSCHKAAKEAMKFRGYYADHYYASYIRKPRWARSMASVGDVGVHKFYAAHSAPRNIETAQGRATNGVASLLIAIPALQGLITIPEDAT